MTNRGDRKQRRGPRNIWSFRHATRTYTLNHMPAFEAGNIVNSNWNACVTFAIHSHTPYTYWGRKEDPADTEIQMLVAEPVYKGLTPAFFDKIECNLTKIIAYNLGGPATRWLLGNWTIFQTLPHPNATIPVLSSPVSHTFGHYELIIEDFRFLAELHCNHFCWPCWLGLSIFNPYQRHFD